MSNTDIPNVATPTKNLGEDEIGLVVGEATSSEFYFVSEKDRYPPKWEYVVVDSTEIIDGKPTRVAVLAQVEKIVSASEALGLGSDIEALRRIKEAELEDVRTWGKARILGYLCDDNKNVGVLLPRRAVLPGCPIRIAPKAVLEKFYSYPEDEGLHMGFLITRPDVPVFCSVSGLKRHLAIIAQTGAGKSYSAGVLVEELLAKGGTILVLDPHADYVLLSLGVDGNKHPYSDRITIFRNPASTGRYANKNLGNVEAYTIAFSDLDPEEICTVARVPSKAGNQREAVRIAVNKLRAAGGSYGPEKLIETLELIASSPENREYAAGARSVLKYVRTLTKLKVFGLVSTPITQLLKPVHCSVVDLSGIDEKSMDYISSRILLETYNKVSSGEFPYPVFIFIEEAHRLIPANTTTFSSSIINRIAAEGRKFGVFLVLITQRPSKIDSNSLSQCNSQIIMKLTNPQDQIAVEQSSERLSKDLLEDLPGLNPGEAVIVGEITRVPVMLKIRPRTTKEGGADIDVLKKLREAREELEARQGHIKTMVKASTPLPGSFSEV